MRRIISYIVLLSLFSIQCEKGANSYSNPTQESFNPGGSGTPGNTAVDFLRGTNFKYLTIEIQYMPGFKPDTRAVNMFIELINARVNKPGGIILVEKEINPTLKEKFTVSDLIAIEARNRTVFTNGDHLSAYLLFTSGSYYSNGNVLGLTYDYNSICFFGEPLKYFTGETAEDNIRLIATLLSHEFGHLLGLVNMGSPMVINHQDYTHGSHCTNNKCIMHYSYEANKSNVERLLSEKKLLEDPSFDENCINDLQANGGK